MMNIMHIKYRYILSVISNYYNTTYSYAYASKYPFLHLSEMYNLKLRKTFLTGVTY